MQVNLFTSWLPNALALTQTKQFDCEKNSDVSKGNPFPRKQKQKQSSHIYTKAINSKIYIFFILKLS